MFELVSIAGLLSIGLLIIVSACFMILFMVSEGYNTWYQLQRKIKSMHTELPITIYDVNVEALKELREKFIYDYERFPLVFAQYKDGIDGFQLIIDELEKTV